MHVRVEKRDLKGLERTCPILAGESSKISDTEGLLNLCRGTPNVPMLSCNMTRFQTGATVGLAKQKNPPIFFTMHWTGLKHETIILLVRISIKNNENTDVFLLVPWHSKG